MLTAIINGRVLVEGEILDEHAILIDGESIKSVIRERDIPKHTSTHDAKGALLVPGFIDIQVNGGGGYLFNDTPTVECIRGIGRAHREFGTTGFLPTLISDDLDVIEKAIKAVDAAIVEGVPGVLGIHIEGPFLNIDRKGVHDPAKFRHLTAENISLLSSLKHGKTLVTLAPENATPALIKQLSETGVIVAAGHTNASYDETFAAIENGVTGFTHLFNAMSPLTSRQPGVVGAALENQTCACGIIVDGRHVSYVTLKIALQCKPIETFIIVTDAMPTVGSDTSSFTLQGREITVRDGVCVTREGTLAGSNLNMALAIKNSVVNLNLTQEQAFNMASLHAAAFLGLSENVGIIKAGYSANIVAINEDFTVMGSWINGKKTSTK